MESDFGQGGVGGARCPRHPEQGAARACGRCGTFMCEECGEWGTQAQCPDCRARTGVGAFPLDRGNWSFSALWDYSWRAFQREWLMLSVGALIVMAIGFAVQLFGGMLPLLGAALESPALSVILQAVALLLQMVVQGVIALGFLRVIYDVLQGQRADVARIFSQVHKAVPYLLTLLLVLALVALPLAGVGGLVGGILYATGSLGEGGPGPAALGVIGLSLLVLLPTALYFLMPLYLLQPAMALREDISPVGIIRHCYGVARGERLSIFGVMMAGALVMMGGVLACCVGLIPAAALVQLLIGGLYLALRSEPEGD